MDHKLILTLIIAYTAVGVFIATAIATVLSMFNLINLEKTLQSKLNKIVIAEIVIICLGAFSGFITLSPQKITSKIDTLNIQNKSKIEHIDSIDKINKKLNIQVEKLESEIQQLKSSINIEEFNPRKLIDCSKRENEIVIKIDEPSLISRSPKNIYKIKGKIIFSNSEFSKSYLKSCGIVLYVYGHVYGDAAYRSLKPVKIFDDGSFEGSIALTPGYKTQIYVEASSSNNLSFETSNAHDVM